MAGNPTAKELMALLAQSAMPQQQGRMSSYNPVRQRDAVLAAAKQAKKAATATPFDKLMAMPTDGHAPKKASGGGGGIMGRLLNNPVGKTVAGGLNLLNVPLSYVVSGVKELTDLADAGGQAIGLDMSTDDHSGASFSEFLKQGRDRIGFGDVLHAESSTAREHPNVEKIGGFVGDVALDPLTYLTFGAGKFAGQAGRIAAGEKVAKSLGNEAGAKIARLGVMGANKAEREAAFAGMKGAEQLAQPGLRWAGVRLPGTGGLAEKVGGTLSKGRAELGDTVVGQSLRAIRAPKGLETAFRNLARGEGDAGIAFDTIKHVRDQAAGEGMFTSQFANKADKLAKGIRKDGDGVAAFTALDEGLVGSHAAGSAAAKGEEFFADAHELASKSIPTLGKREGYAPHVWTAEARKALRGDQFKALRTQIGMDVTEATGGAVKRSIHPGSKLTMPDGSIVEFVADTAGGAVSARQINEKIGGALGGIKVIENDLSKVLHPYIKGIGESVGRAEADAVAGKLSGLGGMVDGIDDAATLAAGKKEAKLLGKGAKTMSDHEAAISKQLRTDGAAAKKATVTQLQADLKQAEQLLSQAKKQESMAIGAGKGIEAQRAAVTREAQASVSAAQKELTVLSAARSKEVPGELAQREALEATKTRAHQAQDAGRKRDLRAQSKGIEGPVRGGKNEVVADASKKLKAHDAEVAEKQAAFTAEREKIMAKMSDAEQVAAKQYDDLDAAKALAVRHRFGQRDAVASITADVKQARANLTRARRINTNPSKRTAAAYDKVERELSAVAKLAEQSPEMAQTASLLSTYAHGIADLRDGHATNQALVQMQKAAAKGDIQPVLKKVIQDGYEQIGHSLLGEDAPIVKKVLAESLRNLNIAIDDPGMWRIVDKYTQYFKTWATSTVGFHVRNAMQATFMNASDGVTVKNMGHGVKLWSAFEKNPRGFLDNLPDFISREQAEDALRAVFASGGGQGQFGAAELKVGQSKLINNKITRFSHRTGGKVEGIARMGMAVDTILGGGTMEEAAARITRIHFDYSQVSKFDVKMKRMIPFWTFLSRNVPLQMQQMFLKPKMYQAYRHLSDNMGQGEDGDMIPLSWRENGGFALTKGTFLTPDLAHLNVVGDIGKLTTDPQRLLADANPILKVPFETLIAKRKLFQDQEFQDGKVVSVSGEGLAPLLPMLKALGLTDEADGETVMNEKLAYAVRGLNPLLAQSQRFFGDDPYYADKRGQSAANYLGLPIKTLTKGQRTAEQKRRNRTATKVDPKAAALLAYSKG